MAIDVTAKAFLVTKGIFNEKWILNEKRHLQGNRGDMRKIHVTWQFFEANGRHEDFSGKTKNQF